MIVFRFCFSYTWRSTGVGFGSAFIYHLNSTSWLYFSLMVFIFIFYADDTQVYISTKPNVSYPPPVLTKCFQDVNIWMTNIFFKLNPNKTEALLVVSRSVLSKTQSFTLFIDNCIVNFSTQVKSLGYIRWFAFVWFSY